MVRRKIEKDENMKTTLLLAMVTLLAATASAEVTTKGGASALIRVPAVKSEARVAAMKCATCKSEFVRVKVPTFKGSTAVFSTFERHACGSCGNTWTTTGHGKAKINVAVHRCGSCTL